MGVKEVGVIPQDSPKIIASAFDYLLYSFQTTEGWHIHRKNDQSPEERAILEDYEDMMYSLAQTAWEDLFIPANRLATPFFEVSHVFSQDGLRYTFSEPLRTDPLKRHVERRLDSNEFKGELSLEKQALRRRLIANQAVIDRNSQPHWLNDIADEQDPKRNARIEYESGFLMYSNTATRGTGNPESDWEIAVQRIKAQTGLTFPLGGAGEVTRTPRQWLGLAQALSYPRFD